MINEIFFDEPMSGDFESDAIELFRNNLSEEKILQSASSLALFWSECIGTLDGEIIIYSSIDSENWSLADNFIIETASNSDDIMIYLIDPYIKYAKIKYIKNGITAGKFSASISITGV